MTWHRNPGLRQELLDALRALGGRAPARAIARETGRTAASITQMCYALLADRVVRREKVGRTAYWVATGLALPLRPTSTNPDRRTEAAVRFDHRVLAASLGMPDLPPPNLPAPRRVLLMGGLHGD